MVKHTGGCHCGRVRFEVVASAQLEVTDCNYSIGNTGTAKHRFCPVCGIKSFYVPRSHPTSGSGVSLTLHHIPSALRSLVVKPSVPAWP